MTRWAAKQRGTGLTRVQKMPQERGSCAASLNLERSQCKHTWRAEEVPIKLHSMKRLRETEGEYSLTAEAERLRSRPAALGAA